jgi:hypothetical protein
VFLLPVVRTALLLCWIWPQIGKIAERKKAVIEKARKEFKP